eukprot:TRINITY_DN1267_c0_g1_i1.p1 TRINITY_DN1267_c0_g1~~TRINITY_DN1267_c0_g1_i1.p1  ORF type:complete len:126 (-),score=17.51 TRINITY_DN1267_c0_g1_i1:38-415(-)
MKFYGFDQSQIESVLSWLSLSPHARGRSISGATLIKTCQEAQPSTKMLTQADLEAIFNEMDVDRSGRVTFEKLRHFTDRLHIIISDDEVRALLSTFSSKSKEWITLADLTSVSYTHLTLPTIYSV